jgi:SAM-dependent methyltransferase
MKSQFLLEKLLVAESLLEAVGAELIKAIYPKSTDDTTIKRVTNAYYKWKAHLNPVTENRQFFDHLCAVLKFNGDVATMMTCGMNEFRRRLPNSAQQKLASNTLTDIKFGIGLSRIYLDPHYDIDHLVDSLERAFGESESRIDQRFLYMGPDSVQHWKKAITGGRYHTYNECLAALTKLIISPEWHELVRSGEYDAIVDLGSGTGKKIQPLVRGFLSRSSDAQLLVSLIDTSLYMLEAASNSLAELIDDYPNRLITHGFRADFLDLRGVADFLHGSKKTIFLCLGSTFANTKEHQLLKAVEDNTRPGDLFIIGAEFLDLSVPSEERKKATEQFKDENIKNLAVAAVRLIPKFKHIAGARGSLEPTISKPRQYSDIQGVRAIKLAVQFGDKEVVVAHSNRYEEKTLRDFIEGSKAFQFILDQPSPDNPQYKLLVFRRTLDVPTPADTPSALPDGQI